MQDFLFGQRDLDDDQLGRANHVIKRLGLRDRPGKTVEEKAVRGMLPKTKMGEAMWRKLKVYAGADHPHASQQPKTKKITSRSEVA